MTCCRGSPDNPGSVLIHRGWTSETYDPFDDPTGCHIPVQAKDYCDAVERSVPVQILTEEPDIETEDSRFVKVFANNWPGQIQSDRQWTHCGDGDSQAGTRTGSKIVKRH